MIDTIDLTYRFSTRRSYDDCYNAMNILLNNMNGKILIVDRNRYLCYYTQALREEGFPHICFFKTKYKSTDKTDNFQYFIKVVFKPILFLKTESLLAKEDDFEISSNKFNELIAKINTCTTGARLPYLNSWVVHRIDFAFDIKTKYANVYLNLLKRGNKGGFKTKLYKTGLRLESPRLNCNFYNKSKQLNLTTETPILRLEIQCNLSYLYFIKNQCEFPEKSLKHFWKNNIAKRVLSSKLKKIIGITDFYSYGFCMKYLDKNKKNYNEKLQLLQLILENDMALTNISASQNNEYRSLKTLLKSLKNQHINPIVIPDKAGIDKLPNLCSIIAVQ